MHDTTFNDPLQSSAGLSRPIKVAQAGHCPDCSYVWELRSLIYSRKRSNEAFLKTLFRQSGYSGPTCWKDFKTFRPEYETLVEYLALGDPRDTCPNRSNRNAGTFTSTPTTPSTAGPPPPYSAISTDHTSSSPTSVNPRSLQRTTLSRKADPRCPYLSRFVRDKFIPMLEKHFKRSFRDIQRWLRFSIALWQSTGHFLHVLEECGLHFDRQVLGRKVDGCMNEWFREQRNMDDIGTNREGDEFKVVHLDATLDSRVTVISRANVKVRVEEYADGWQVEIDEPEVARQSARERRNMTEAEAEGAESDEENTLLTKTASPTERPWKRVRTGTENRQREKQQPQHLRDGGPEETAVPAPPPSSPSPSLPWPDLLSSPPSACFDHCHRADLRSDSYSGSDSSDDEDAGARISGDTDESKTLLGEDATEDEDGLSDDDDGKSSECISDTQRLGEDEYERDKQNVIARLREIARERRPDLSEDEVQRHIAGNWLQRSK